jgi:hypothetical protein
MVRHLVVLLWHKIQFEAGPKCSRTHLQAQNALEAQWRQHPTSMHKLLFSPGAQRLAGASGSLLTSPPRRGVQRLLYDLAQLGAERVNFTAMAGPYTATDASNWNPRSGMVCR